MYSFPLPLSQTQATNQDGQTKNAPSIVSGQELPARSGHLAGGVGAEVADIHGCTGDGEPVMALTPSTGQDAIPPAGKIILYTRESVQFRNRDNCECQEQRIRTDLLHRGIDTVAAVAIHDRIVNRTRTYRLGFDKVLQMMRDGNIRILAVDALSRLTRLTNLPNFITDLDGLGGRFISVGENIDTAFSSPSMFAQTGYSLAGWLHAKRIRQSLVERARSADGCSGVLPYGYRARVMTPTGAEEDVIGLTSGIVEVDPGEAEVIRMIFREYADNHKSFDTISAELNLKAIPKGPRSRLSYWSRWNVQDVLFNPRYVGRWTHGVTHAASRRSKYSELGNGAKTTTERPNLRIVDPALWDRAQAHRAAQAESRKAFYRQWITHTPRSSSDISPVAG